MFINLDKNKVVRWRWRGFVACKLLNTGSALHLMRWHHVIWFWTNEIARTILDCCAIWNPTFALVLTAMHGSGEQTAGLNLRPSVAGTVHRSVGSSSPNGAETNTVGSSILLTKKTISLKQLNVQRTFKFLSSSLLSTFNNPVSQAVFQSLRSKLCGLKDFCEV